MRESFSIPEPEIPAPTLIVIIGGMHQPTNVVIEGKQMRKQVVGGIVGLGALLIVTGGAYPAAGETNKLGGDEGPVMEATGSPSFGTEDWTGPEEQAPVVAVQPPSFGTEDWTGPEEQAPVVAEQPPSFGTEDWTGPAEQGPIVMVKSPSLGTEDWTGSMESSEAVGAGAIPETPCEDVSPDDYSPEC
jgi:hypothetical protein